MSHLSCLCNIHLNSVRKNTMFPKNLKVSFFVQKSDPTKFIEISRSRGRRLTKTYLRESVINGEELPQESANANKAEKFPLLYIDFNCNLINTHLFLLSYQIFPGIFVHISVPFSALPENGHNP